jgi:hypothetical protein
VDRVHGRWATAGCIVCRGPVVARAWGHSDVVVHSLEHGLWPLPGTGAHWQRHKRDRGSTGNISRASPELGWSCGGWSMAMKQWWQWNSVAVTLELGGIEKMRGEVR